FLNKLVDKSFAIDFLEFLPNHFQYTKKTLLLCIITEFSLIFQYLLLYSIHANDNNYNNSLHLQTNSPIHHAYITLNEPSLFIMSMISSMAFVIFFYSYRL